MSQSQVINPNELKLKLIALKQSKKELTKKIMDSNDYTQRMNIIKEIKEIVNKLTLTEDEQKEQTKMNEPTATTYCEFNKKNDKKSKKK